MSRESSLSFFPVHTQNSRSRFRRSRVVVIPADRITHIRAQIVSGHPSPISIPTIGGLVIVESRGGTSTLKVDRGRQNRGQVKYRGSPEFWLHVGNYWFSSCARRTVCEPKT